MRLATPFTKSLLICLGNLSSELHGRQARLPLPSWMVGSRALTTNYNLPTWRSQGLSVEDGESCLHISSGIGTSPYAPFRVGTKSEGSLVNLTS